MGRRRARLALWIYLAGLLQIAVVVAGFLLLARVRAAGEASRMREARAAVTAVAAALGDDAAVARELDRVERELDATVTLHDAAGRVLATNRREGDPPPMMPPPPPRGGHPMGPPPGGPPHLRHPPPEGRGPGGPGVPVPAFVMPIPLRDGGEGMGVFALRGPPPVARDAPVILVLVLGAVGVVSLLLARSLARPLGRLAQAARDFGGGRLEARAGLTRSDEIGEVAAAFDEMADRVTALLRAEKELLANVSHELRTPLSRIRVALDLAEEGDSATAREALSEIAEDLAELERLISDVLTAARLDLGDDAAIPPLRRAPIDLTELLERSAARFRSACPARPLRVSIAAELPAVDGDAVLLHRAVDNLLTNAHKYSREPGDEVSLEAGLDGDALHVEVRDRGVGISAADLPLVFRPFFRVDRSRTRATGGLGLGLALARRIVEAHGGTLTLESRLGEGTRAVIRLPLAHNR